MGFVGSPGEDPYAAICFKEIGGYNINFNLMPVKHKANKMKIFVVA